MKSLFASSILLLLTVSVLFSPRPLSAEGWAVWFSWAPSPITDLTAFKKMLRCYSLLSELISAFVHSKQDEKQKHHNIDRKSYSNWWHALGFFLVGITILMRFVAKSLHINVKEVHMRLWIGVCLKQGKGHLNFKTCFYSIHLFVFPHSIAYYLFFEKIPR